MALKTLSSLVNDLQPVYAGIMGIALGFGISAVIAVLFTLVFRGRPSNLGVVSNDTQQKSKTKRKSKQDRQFKSSKSLSASSILNDDIFNLPSSNDLASASMNENPFEGDVSNDVLPEPSIENSKPTVTVSNSKFQKDSNDSDFSIVASDKQLLNSSTSFPSVNDNVSTRKQNDSGNIVSNVTATDSQQDTADQSEWNVASKKEKLLSENVIKTKLNRLEDECAHYRESYSALSKLYDELKKKADNFEKEKRHLSSGFSQKINSLESELSAVKNANISLSNEQSMLHQQLSTLDQIPTLKSRLNELQGSNDTLKSELENLQFAVDENEQLKDKFKAFEVIAAEYESTKALLSASNAALESEKVIRVQAENQVVLLENELSAFHSNSQALPIELEALKVENSMLVKERHELIQQNAQLQEEIASLSGSLEKSMMNEALNTLEKEKTSSQLATMDDKMIENKNALDNAQNEIQQLKDALKAEQEKYSNEMEHTAKVMNAFKQRIRENESQLSLLKEQLK